jgi:2-aminoadipate transaminase
MMHPLSHTRLPLLAQRAERLRSSAIRDLLHLAGRADVVSLAGGLPDAASFPAEALREAADRVLRQRPQAALQYGPTEGIAPLREWVAAHLEAQGMRFSPSQILITSGSQQGLDLLGKVLIDNGSPVLVERPSYLGALQAFALYGPRLIGIEADDDGPLPAPFAAAMPGARLAYLQPRFSNPAGRSIAPARADALAAQLAASNTWLVEDDPYGELWFDEPPAPGLIARGVPQGAHLGTFSKVLAPGLRLAWVAGPQMLIDKLAQAKQAADLQTASFNQWVLLEALHADVIERGLPGLRTLYRSRRDAMLAALTAHMPAGVLWTQPAGGLFVWLTLPAGMDAATLLPQAVARGVAYVPGETFNVGAAAPNTLRLSFSNVEASVLQDAVARLGALFTEALAAAPAVTAAASPTP